MKRDFLKLINQANIYDVVKRTPLDFQTRLSQRFKNNIFLKREDQQPIHSFKIRGAYYKMSQMKSDLLEKGVIAASAGNHAQGVAMAAKKLNSPAIIVMPKTTPEIKIDAVKQLGAKVVLEGSTLTESIAYARSIEKNENLTFIHPFDDPDVIVGQGTIGKEILEDFKDPIFAVFCCVGGGGLISGIASYIKSIDPKIKIIGVEAKDSEAMTNSLKANEIIHLDRVGLFAEGAAVRQVGETTFNMAQKYVDEMIVVDNDAICAAIKDVYIDNRTILEPAGALATAGIKAYLEKNHISEKNIIGIASGANINFDRLGFVTERAEIGEHREAIISVTIPEKPGAFKSFCNLIGERNITEFNYRYSDPKQAQIFVGITINHAEEIQDLLKNFVENGLSAVDLTNNEMAKLHLRHLVGGHAPNATDEVVLRFEFPERPGALLNFLNHMGQNWNISLFHYRNHAADIGRVLVGIQVPKKDQETFKIFLDKLEYPYFNETENEGYKLFLGKN